MVYLRRSCEVDIEKDIYKLRRFFENKVSGYQETALTAYMFQVLLDIVSLKRGQGEPENITDEVCLAEITELGFVVDEDETNTMREILRIRPLLTSSVFDATISIKGHLRNVSYAATIKIFYRALQSVNALDSVMEDTWEILKRIFKHRKYVDDYLEKIVATM